MIKVLINNEEVVSNHNLEIKEEMLSTSSTILKNCYPKVWENDKDYTSRYYYPKDYSKCKIYNLPRENTTQEQTGINLSFETYTGKSTIEDIKFYGNTQQNGTPTPSSPVPIQSVTGRQEIDVVGKNLLDSTQESYTLPANTTNYQKIWNTKPYLEAGTKYYISYNIDNASSSNTRSTPRLYLNQQYVQNSQTNQNLTTGRKVWEFTPTVSGNYEVQYWLQGSNVDVTVSKFMISKSNNTTYEPYKGNTYEVNLGKNIWSVGNKNVSWATNYVDVKNILNTLSEGTYSITLNFKVTEIVKEKTNNLYGFAFYNSNGVIANRKNTNSNINVDDIFTFVYTFTISKTQVGNFTNAYFYGFGNNTDNVTARSLMYDCQLEKGTQATSYSPYFTPIELNKIGNYQDRIYKDNGKWYLEKNIGKVVLDGSEANWSKSGNTTFDRFVLGAYNINGIVAQGGYSNYFEVATIYVANNLYEMSNNGNSQLVFNYSTYGTTDLTTFKTWLSTHNIELKYVLATPTYTEITNEELINQLESLNIQLYEGQTNFIINGSLPMPTYIKIYTNFEELIFCGFTKNTGNVSLNPREFHGVDLQILDFKDLLSTGETLNYVIANKTITEAINQVVNSISDYGFVVGEIQLLNPDEIIGAYSTLNKTAYDVFQYIADITQSRWTTRMIDENTIAIDFYDPSLMPTGVDIDKTQTFYENYKIIDMSFNYSTNDYRNKQIMTSDEVYANITQTETIIADGYATSFMCQNKIGIITSIKLNGVEKTFATKSEEKLGITADFVYQPGETTFISNNSIGAGGVIIITYYPIVKGREIILNNTESDRIESQINRNGTISRYENRNDTTSSQELQKIGQSYIKYKGNAEINLKIVSELNTWNVGEIVSYNAPISELSTTYMIKSKQISMYLNANKIIYTYNLTSNYNCENAVNYFDNQRAKNQGNIGEGETITRNIDLTNDALILFYDTNVEEIQAQNSTSLDFALDGVLI